MNNSVNSKNNADITATINANKEETIMGNNTANTNEVTVNTENEEVNTMTDNTKITKEADNKAGEAVTAGNQSNEEKRPMSEVEREWEAIRPLQVPSGKKNGCRKTTTIQKSNKKEADTMANTNNNSAGAPLEDISSLIPIEEQAVVEGKVIFYEMPNVYEDLLSEIPEDEQEDVPEPEITDLALVREQGCFLPVQGMKGFMSEFGDRIYARVHVDARHNRFIEYCQQYRNNEISAKMSLPYADLMIAASYKFNDKVMPAAWTKRIVAKFLMDTTRDYYNKLDYPEEQLDIVNLLNTLVANYSKLPLTSDVPKYDTPEALYSDTIRNVKKLGMALVDEHEAYYTLDMDQMDMVAEGMGMKRDELLKKLKEYNMLYLTSSSRGYQSNIRFKNNNTENGKEYLGKSHTEWCYCVLKLEYLAMRRKKRSEK